MTLRLGEKGAKGWFYSRVGVDIFVFYTIKWVRSHMKEVLDTRHLIASIVRWTDSDRKKGFDKVIV